MFSKYNPWPATWNTFLQWALWESRGFNSPSARNVRNHHCLVWWHLEDWENLADQECTRKIGFLYILPGDLTWSGPSTRHGDMIELLVNLESPTTNFRNFSTIAQRPWEWDPLQELALLRRRPSLRGTPCWRYKHICLFIWGMYLSHVWTWFVKISSFSVLMSGFQMYSPFLICFEMPAFQNEMISDSQRSPAYKLNTSQWWRWPWTVASFWSMLEDLWTISVTLRARFKDKNPNQGPVKSPGDSSILPLTCPENSWIFFGPQSFYTDPKGHTTSEMQTIKFRMK